MKGQVGLKFVIPPACYPEAMERYPTNDLMDQLDGINFDYVMLNLTGPAYPSSFTSTNPVLRAMSVEVAPERDLLSEMVDHFTLQNKPVYLYFATDPVFPSRRADEKRQLAMTGNKIKNPYRRHLADVAEIIEAEITKFGTSYSMTSDDFAACVLDYYCRKFLGRVTGFWFDHGRYGNSERLIQTVTDASILYQIAWNNLSVVAKHEDQSVYGPARAAVGETYTAGHCTPTRDFPPWWEGNEKVVELFEERKTQSSFEIQRHWTLPMQERWLSGEVGFTKTTFIGWTRRVTAAGGAITWAAGLAGDYFNEPLIGSKQIEYLKLL